MPPLVVGAVVAAGAAFAGASLAIAVSIGTMAMALMAVLTAKKPSFDSYRSPQERKQVLRSAAASKNAVYGTVMGSGVLFFAEEQAGGQTEGEWLHMCLTVAGHQIDGIEGILLNDEPVDNYGGFVSWEFHNNRQTVDPFLLNNCASWRSDMIGKGIAFLRISFKFDAEKFPSGIPNVKWIKRGWHVYDPRDSQTKFSANASLVYLHFLRHYRKVSDADILWDQFIAAANISAEAVQIGDNQYENRYLLNCEFDIEENPTKVMQAMLDACAGQAVYTGGKHGLLVGAYNGPAIHDIYEYQIVGDIQITPETSLADRCNTMTGKFVNKDDGYTECDFPKVTVQQYVTEDGREYVEDVNYRFVTSVFQAQRLAMMNLQRKRIGRTITVPMNFSAFAYRPGESVNLYMPSLGIAGVEHKIVKWDFSLRDAIGLVLVQDTPEIYGDIIGRPIVRPPLTTLPTSGPAMPDQLRFTTTPVGEVVQGQLTWLNYGIIAYNEVIVKRGTATVTTVQLPGQVCRLGGLAAGDYSAMVRAVALNGVPSPWATIAFTVAVPPVPNSVDVEVGNWDVSLFPKFTTSLAFGTICEFFYYRSDLASNEVESTAQLLGMGTSLVHTGLRPDTLHYYWVRSVNAYGKSALLAVTARTSKDVDSVLDIISGEIGAEALKDELQQEIAKIPVLETDVKTESTIRQEADTALGQRIDTVSAKVNENTSAIQTEATTRADETSALAKRVDTVQATVGENTASIQTVATAGTTNDGQTMNAMWSTRASLNDITGGFGLLAEQDPDGVTRIKFLVDADIFAVLDRSGGKRNPFVIKDGVVYMNKLLLDNAEIGEVIAKYIKVDRLVGTVIEGGKIKGGAAAFGPGGPYAWDGGSWHTVLTSDGRIVSDSVQANGGYFTGTVNAQAGVFNNVTINENCNVLGTIYAQKLVGDVTATKSLRASVPAGAFQISARVAPSNMIRDIVIGGIFIKVTGPGDFERSLTATVNINGAQAALFRVAAKSLGAIDGNTVTASYRLPANIQGEVVVSFSGGTSAGVISLEGAYIQVFKADSGTFN